MNAIRIVKLRSLARGINRISVIVGQITSYIVLLSILLISISVVLRYFFNLTYVALDEIQYYCYSIIFLFGLSYVYKENGHIRVDVLYQKLSSKNQKRINLFGTLFFAIPWTSAVCYYSYIFFLKSFKVSERSIQPTGLPALYILKFILFLAFILLLLQSIAKAIEIIIDMRLDEVEGE